MNMFLSQCWRMKDAKSCEILLSKLTRLLNIESLILYEYTKIAKSWFIIDFIIQGDQNIIVTEQEKIEEYQDL